MRELFRKRWVVALLVVLSAGVCAGGIYFTWLNTPPPMPVTAEQGIAMLNSERFKNMPAYRQDEYRAQIRTLMEQLPEEQRHAVFEAARSDPKMRDALRELGRSAMRAKAFEFARASADERKKIIEADMAEEDKRRGRFPFGPPGSQPRSQPSGNFADRMKQRMKSMFQTGNPQENGLMGEYMEARRAARDAAAKKKT